ncbi:GIY-YIG nuclease family protein [Aequorivita sp. H23M31]|uniref:GIY-YIG nuclease family protein n=1 Tax=Aequorivita ciconiae TaxID=2494375 RepID=A0A410G2J4_9FLAO|nr:GIY-YIG nuclease family protein [Aequorivita sp. H23M31]QAA81498.1 GIY-YIG nuclease family protein [Aequorivita sp. H23M31]
MQYYVYILYSSAINRYYIGHTGEPIEERLRKHLSNHSGFTSKAKDWEIKYTERFRTKSEAYTRELYIKRKKSVKFIQNLISSAGYPPIPNGTDV